MTTRSPPKRKAAPEGKHRAFHKIVNFIYVIQSQKLKPTSAALNYYFTYLKTKPTITYLCYFLYQTTKNQAIPSLPYLITTTYLPTSYTYPPAMDNYLTTTTYLLTSHTYLPDMDTSAGPSKRNVRADITRKYDERVAATTALIDPHRAKARDLLRDVQDGVVTDFEGTFKASKDPPKYEAPKSYLEAPLLTLRELMPGSMADGDDEGELDQAFRADKIEFLVMVRDLAEEEKEEDAVTLDAGDVDWDIPNKDEFEDVMGQVFDLFTEETPDLVHAFKWASVGSATGVGCFSVSTGRREHINDIRGIMSTIIYNGRCYESFPKRAMIKSFSLTAFFPRATKFVGMGRLIEWVFSCNRGLKGTIWPSSVKKFPDDHPHARKRGARILSFTGDQAFLDSLHAFPRGFPFSVKLANVYIQGGERTKAGQTSQRRRRPRMTEQALKELLARHGKDIIDDAEDEHDKHSGGSFGKT